MEKISELKRFLVSARKLVNKIPKFNSKFSNKIYDNHQKLIILIFKQKMRMTYRGIVRFFRFSYVARALLNLRNVPDHSTLVKFHKRIKVRLLDSLLCKKFVKTSAIDGSGFETTHMSYYYANAWNRQDKRKHRRYLKISIAICTDSQYILAQKIRLGPRNDNIDFERVMKDISCKYVVADKGYDSRSNRLFVLNNLKAYPHIPYRKYSGVTYTNNGTKKVICNNKIYHQRSKVETVFSVIKRKYGSFVLSKTFETQKRELLIRLVAYNIDRKIILSLVIVGIHQSLDYSYSPRIA